MWLININTDTLELHEFIDAAHAPPYAILSHCWGQVLWHNYHWCLCVKS